MKPLLRKFIDSITIRAAVVILFILSICITVGAISYAIYTTWSTSNDQVIHRLADNLNHEIIQRIRDDLLIPESVIRLNLGLIENKGIDFNDPLARNRLFLNTLRTQDEMIYSFAFGSREGEYYGARRNELDQ